MFVVAGSTKRKHNEAEGKEGSNKDKVNSNNSERHTYAVLNKTNYHVRKFFVKNEAINFLNMMNDMGVGGTFEIISASSEDGLDALINNKKKEKAGSSTVVAGACVQEDIVCGAGSETGKPRAIGSPFKALKIRKARNEESPFAGVHGTPVKSGNQFLDTLQRKGIKFVVRVYSPCVPKNQTVLYKCITVDLIDTKKNETFWVHKAEFWAEMFELVDQIPSKLVDNFPPLFKSMAFGKKRLVPGGNNLPSVWTTPQSKRPVERQLLYAVVEAKATKDDICKELGFWGVIAADEPFREAYVALVSSKISSKVFVDAVSAPTGYWNKLSAACSNIEFSESNELSDELMDDEIKGVVSTVFQPDASGLVPPALWNEYMIAYAGPGFNQNG